MKRIIMLAAVLGLWTSLHAQKVVPPLPTDELARVGNSVITGRDLIERIELMPWPEKEKPLHHDSAKVKALNSLIAERLLAIEGRHQNLGGDEISHGKIQAMEKLFVRDEIYKREVTQKVRVTEAEIRDGLAKFMWQLHLAAVAVKDRQAGESFCRQLGKDPSLAAALAAFPRQSVTAVETVQVNFGGLDTAFENAAYSIGKKRFSMPFECETYGWVVAVMLDRGTNPVAEKMTDGDRRYRVDEIIRNRKAIPVARRFMASVLAPEKAAVDSSLFRTLARGLRAVIMSDSLQHHQGGLYMLSSEDCDAALAAMKADAHKPLVSLTSGAITLGEAVDGFRFLHVGFPSLDEKKFAFVLNSRLRFVVETELIAREGYRRNLQYSANVKRDADVWANYWESRYLRWNVEDSLRVSDDEMCAALDSTDARFGAAYEVKIQEVLCGDMETAARVLSECAKGTSLGALAKTYSARKEWKDSEGVSGYMTLNAMPELTRRAFLAAAGSVVGPVRSGAGYSVFRVLDKRKAGTSDFPAVDTVLTNIRQNLTAQKRQKAMNTYVAGLAQQHRVDIHYDKLSAIKIQPANMFTRRAIGFGGVIPAVPVLLPNWEWVKEYRGGGTILP